ncbi:NUDIX hydrolase [Tumidithrix elongata RA019]|uniref:NUDIX hydrolase n=1 Tax=Tumidithrix elongata BACA0141 TaxID=2716417 RepID=A0AAW9PTX8_9CYAN|nr:NUDIX hydrolase [Tumidithrix elongata RA019]
MPKDIAKETIVPSQLLDNRLQHNGKKFSYRVDKILLPNGVTGEYAYIKHPGAGLAVPVTADGKFILVRQYRFAIQRYLLEFPAGTLEVNEAPGITIHRELEEETGYRAHRWQKLGTFFICPGYSDEVIHAYLAQDLEKLEHPPAQDDDEEIEVVQYDRHELDALIHSGNASTGLDAKSITAFYLALQHLKL